LNQSRIEAHRAYEEFHSSRPDWAWKFKILEAKSALSTQPSENVLKFLKSEPLPDGQPDVAIPVLTLIGIAHINMREFAEAGRSLSKATQLCSSYTASSCGEVLQARALLASQQNDSVSAEQLYQASLTFARQHGNHFLEATSLLNLGNESLMAAHYDEAIDRSQAADQAAKVVGAKVVGLIAQGNIGWAYYELGDSEKALELFLAAGKQASELGDSVDQGAWLTDAGYVYLSEHNFDLAGKPLRQALDIELSVKSKEEIYNVERALARLAIQAGDPDKASYYAEQAMNAARADNNHLHELYPELVQGQVAASRGDSAKAREILTAVDRDPGSPAFLRWEAEHSLARLYEDQKQRDAADHEYRAALATFEAARSTVEHEDFQLSFLTNASSIYDDYIHFLLAQEKSGEALRWADYSRARTLAEGLGILRKSTNGNRPTPAFLDPQQISRRVKGVLLFYWLGEKQSYLWAIAPRATQLFSLPPAAEIDKLVQRYRRSLNGPGDVLESSEEGRALYRTLVAPANGLLKSAPRVLIMPDGSLNNLNFETLIVETPRPHFWIDDADVANASSLRMLAAALADSRVASGTRQSELLLIGDSVAPSQEYPELPRAGEQMASVAKHFPATKEVVYRRDRATPAAYLDSNLDQFSYIHFVAHGTASRLSPLDSAIVLSRPTGDEASFKLYARDIISRRVHAELITISACYGAGERAYAGEGLVGLAWAFLRAGAHNVIAGLWEVSDASTEQLMDTFYDELSKGASPDAALRKAKLSLLHGAAFHHPFYWAPFQLYTGS
jgi:CHAT domain-containing protein